MNFWHPVLERCGLILKDDSVIYVENSYPNPSKGFLIPEEILNQYSDKIKILWHSHPSNNTNLSIEDYKNFLAYPQFEHRIYGYNCFTDYYVRNDIVYIRDQS